MVYTFLKGFPSWNWSGLNVARYLTVSLRGSVLTLRRGRSPSLFLFHSEWSYCRWEVSKETFSGSFHETFSGSFQETSLEVSCQNWHLANFLLKKLTIISRFLFLWMWIQGVEGGVTYKYTIAYYFKIMKFKHIGSKARGSEWWRSTQYFCRFALEWQFRKTKHNLNIYYFSWNFLKLCET